MRLRMRRSYFFQSFESQVTVRSSKQFQAWPAIYQFHAQRILMQLEDLEGEGFSRRNHSPTCTTTAPCIVTPVVARSDIRSDILNGFPGLPVSRVGLSPSLTPRMHREQENQGREQIRRGRGQVVFIPAFRNLPAVPFVPLFEQSFT